MASKESEEDGKVRIPDLLDARFVGVIKGLKNASVAKENKVEKILAQLSLDSQQDLSEQEGTPQLGQLQSFDSSKVQQWCFFGNASSSVGSSSAIETETSSLVAQICQKLQQSNLPPSAILTSTILLRHMTDFPAVNAIYGALFDVPNPPSRVCVACGDSLSALTAGSNSDSNSGSRINIAIYLTVYIGFTNKTDQRRQGLHVQSRSYWAPANIGPYSQAISIPLTSLSSSSSPSSSQASPNGNDGPRLVTIAGQIPLVPATMTLPPVPEDIAEQGQRQSLNTQLALSLQHLWRIGLEVGVQWWTSAVAYFPADTGSSSSSASSSPVSSISIPMSEKAKLAYKTWKSAHQWSSSKLSSLDSDADSDNSDSEIEDDESGPDLWDRKFNPKYMSFATTTSSSYQSSSGEPKLPDWSILSNKTSKKKKRKIIPPFFAAQVAELPRSAGVEWHAHLGLSKVSTKSVLEVLDSFLVDVVDTNDAEKRVVEVYQTAMRSPASSSSTSHHHDDDDEDGSNNEGNGGGKRQPAFLQTILVERRNTSVGGGSPSSSFTKLDEIARLAANRLADATATGQEHGGEGRPSVMARYVDVGLSGPGDGCGSVQVPVVPCASLWSGDGERLASVTIYQSVFE